MKENRQEICSMNYEVIAIPNFNRRIKELAKKYPSIKSDFLGLLEKLEQGSIQGTFLGNSCYKIRMSITSKGKGKSGGARVIICLQISKQTVYLLSIYDKSEQEVIHLKDLRELLKQIPK